MYGISNSGTWLRTLLSVAMKQSLGSLKLPLIIITGWGNLTPDAFSDTLAVPCEKQIISTCQNITLDAVIAGDEWSYECGHALYYCVKEVYR